MYLGAVEAALARNKTALILVPEIALTLWCGRLFRARFGAGVAVLHSALPEVERAREWWRVRRGEARVVVGTRSAVFAPVENLGLIVVDEEQEASYKQEETPRYHGRDVAVVRAKLEGAVALLGSATPSLESFQNARSGKYHLLQLDSRVENRPLAPVEIVDLREDFKATHRAGPISSKLSEAIAARLAEGTQSLILINRRGYSWFVLCRSCGAGVQCENCSISLTYHKQRAAARMPLLRILAARAGELPEVQFRTRLFFRRGRGTARRKTAREISRAQRSRAWTAIPCAPSAPTSRCWAISRPGKSTSWWARRWSRRGTIFSASRSSA